MSKENLELAAQCWCDEETKNVEMIPCLAEAFAKRLDEKDKLILQLQDFATWMTGCGYSFSDHQYYLDNRHLLTGGTKCDSLELEDQ